MCFGLGFFYSKKGSPLWMPISCSILNQMRQFQSPWVCPQIVYNLSFYSNTKPVEGLTTEKPTILMCSLTSLSILISMEEKANVQQALMQRTITSAKALNRESKGFHTVRWRSNGVNLILCLPTRLSHSLVRWRVCCSHVAFRASQRPTQRRRRRPADAY